MKKDTLFLLGLVGLGLYLYYRKKSNITFKNAYPTAPNPVIPQNETGVPIPQTLDKSYTNANDYQRAYFSLSGYKKLGNIPNTI
jgi:hypothetical protein